MSGLRRKKLCLSKKERRKRKDPIYVLLKHIELRLSWEQTFGIFSPLATPLQTSKTTEFRRYGEKEKDNND